MEMEKKTLDYDVAIIGGWCGRSDRRDLLRPRPFKDDPLRKSLVGGLATYTDEIEIIRGLKRRKRGSD